MKLSTRQKIIGISALTNILLVGMTLGAFALFTQYFLQRSVEGDLLTEAEEIVTQHISIEDSHITYVKTDSNLTIEEDLLTDRLSARILTGDLGLLGNFGMFGSDVITSEQETMLNSQAKSACSSGKYTYSSDFPVEQQEYKLIFYPVIKDSICYGIVIVASDLSNISSLEQITLTLAVAALALAVLLNTLAAGFTASTILKPILSVIKHMRKVSVEENVTKLESPLIPADEISQLIDTFNAMIERISEGAAKQKSFIMDASHELKTPIARALTDLDIAKLSIKQGKPKNASASLTSAQEDLQVVAKIIDTLLQAARLKQVALRLVPINLKGLLSKEIKTLNDAHQYPIPKVTLELTNETVLADLQVITLIIRNCLVNAYKYNTEDGTITVSIHTVGRTYSLQITNTTDIKGRVAAVDSSKLGFSIIRNLCSIAQYSFTAQKQGRIYTTIIAGIKFFLRD